jgi:hypothetical protein
MIAMIINLRLILYFFFLSNDSRGQDCPSEPSYIPSEDFGLNL